MSASKNDEGGLTDTQKEFAKFLDRDFTQCFQQMRHYDAQTVDILKFALTAYVAVGGGALAIYKYGVEKGIGFRVPAAAITVIGVLVGVLLLGMVSRKRTYFVVVARYVNEHRRFFLGEKPLGFTNPTQMYMDSCQPPYFQWRSSQVQVAYLLAALNSALLGVGVFVMAACSRYPAPHPRGRARQHPASAREWPSHAARPLSLALFALRTRFTLSAHLLPG